MILEAPRPAPAARPGCTHHGPHTRPGGPLSSDRRVAWPSISCVPKPRLPSYAYRRDDHEERATIGDAQVETDLVPA